MPVSESGDVRFACPYCQTRTANFDELKEHVLSAHRSAGVPKPDGWIRLTINGLDHSLPVAPEWTLYELIHDRLGFIGAKQFCDRGACGSCTVILDGRPILSCMTLAIECDGSRIETVEGIARAGHPLIESYARNHAMQCGYCTPGFVVAAKALLDRNPEPSEDEIKEALAGNLCRCGTYPQHPIAVLEAAARLKERTTP
jgi:aerobic-type carbon monoxide dehydrogenase small subunit (CoxS/CutS family)